MDVVLHGSDVGPVGDHGGARGDGSYASKMWTTEREPTRMRRLTIPKSPAQHRPQ